MHKLLVSVKEFEPPQRVLVNGWNVFNTGGSAAYLFNFHLPDMRFKRGSSDGPSFDEIIFRVCLYLTRFICFSYFLSEGYRRRIEDAWSVRWAAHSPLVHFTWLEREKYSGMEVGLLHNMLAVLACFSWYTLYFVSSIICLIQTSCQMEIDLALCWYSKSFVLEISHVSNWIVSMQVQQKAIEAVILIAQNATRFSKKCVVLCLTGRLCILLGGLGSVFEIILHLRVPELHRCVFFSIFVQSSLNIYSVVRAVCVLYRRCRESWWY
jgi:hypothetical protein